MGGRRAKRGVSRSPVSAAPPLGQSPRSPAPFPSAQSSRAHDAELVTLGFNRLSARKRKPPTARLPSQLLCSCPSPPTSAGGSVASKTSVPVLAPETVCGSEQEEGLCGCDEVRDLETTSLGLRTGSDQHLGVSCRTSPCEGITPVVCNLPACADWLQQPQETALCSLALGSSPWVGVGPAPPTTLDCPPGQHGPSTPHRRVVPCL